MCLFAVVGCSGPKLDFDKAEDNLKDEDYMVTVSEKYSGQFGEAVEEYLYAFNEDGDNLTIIKFEKVGAAKKYYKSLKMSYDHEVEEIKLQIEMCKYYIKNFEDDLSSDEIDMYEDEIKDLKEELEDMKKETAFGRSGKYVWFGDKDAIKDTK